MVLKASFAKKEDDDPGVRELKESLARLSLVSGGPAGKKAPLEMISGFFSGAIEVLVKMKEAKSFRAMSNMLFERADTMYPKYFTPLKSAVEAADMRILPESYVGLCLGVPLLVALSALGAVLVEAVMLEFSPLLKLALVAVIPAVMFAATFFAIYSYPFQKLSEKERSIETNLAFAVNHLAAIASSGVPPKRSFEMMAEYAEYGAISAEARNIVRRMNVFGEDLTQALAHISRSTPSRSFRDLLHGIISITESGGNLKEYLNDVAALALFNYQLARKKYIETLSTYADIYTAILIAAPLFLVAILTVMNIIPGSIGGLSIDSLMWLGVYVLIPLMNIGFIAFIAYTQPEI